MEVALKVSPRPSTIEVGLPLGRVIGLPHVDRDAGGAGSGDEPLEAGLGQRRVVGKPGEERDDSHIARPATFSG
jgi:hypothetical protein